MTKFTMCIVEDVADICIIVNPFCEKCAKSKLCILKIFKEHISRSDVIDLHKNYGIKVLRIKCMCSSD
jgi:hypothetical protein